MRAWLRPTLGALLFIAVIAGVAYKVIGGYRHAAPDAFISVQDQNKVPAAQAPTAEPPAVSAATAAVPPVSAAPVAVAPGAAALAAPSRVSRDAKDYAASVAPESESTDAQNDSCAAIKTEQHEIEGALNKKYSSEEGRYLQRRLRELTEQSVKNKCGE